MFGDETNTYKQFVVVFTQCSTLHEIRTALSFVFTATIHDHIIDCVEWVGTLHICFTYLFNLNKQSRNI